MTELEQALRDLAQLRACLSIYLAQEKEVETILDQTDPYKLWVALREDRLAFEATVAEQYEKVRELACNTYRDTQDKHPAKGVDVAVRRVVVYDRLDATKWAQNYAPGLLTLDDKRFEKSVLDGVFTNTPADIEEVYMARVAKDLSDWLPYQGDGYTDGADPDGDGVG